MAHELRPKSGSFPSASEVAQRLAAEFAYVSSDEADGMKQAQARAQWIETAPAHLFLGHHQQALDAAARLRRLSPGEAATIEFGDSPKKTKRILVLPGEPVSFGYGSKEEEASARELVDRCARALDCDVVLI